uniref:Integrase catalytic domain-containing protein n=1 Tax=Tanacetum cinerariifolium TaxID=118510 RepID=A0A6L2K862_TANCI|nr:hypothetical protein [Tanacetum cinerariifolium]
MERKKALTVNPEQHQASPDRSPNEAAMDCQGGKWWGVNKLNLCDIFCRGVAGVGNGVGGNCDVYQVGDKREVEVLHSFNWPLSQLITDDDVLPERGYSQFNDFRIPCIESLIALRLVSAACFVCSAIQKGEIYRTENPKIRMEKTKHNKIPLWVKFTNVPMEARSIKGLSALASSVGKPIIMDHMTDNVRKNGTGKESVELQYRGKNNVVKGTKIVKIEYDWKPYICNHCMVFGYSWQQCKKRKRTIEKVSEALKTNMYDNRKGGFQFDGGKSNVEKEIVNVESGNNKEKSFEEEFPSLPVRNDKGKNDVITPSKGRQENKYSVLADVESDDLDEIKMLKDRMIVEREDALMMVREVTNEEVKPAIFDIGENKGLVDYTSSFPKKAWHIVGNDVCKVVKEFFFLKASWAFFEKQKLYGPKFIDSYRQLRLVLSVEDKLNYLELLIPAAYVPAVVGQPVPPETLTAHAAWVKGQNEIVVLMLMTMEPDLQQNLENLGAYDMLKELKTLFSQQAEHKLLQTIREENHKGKGKSKLAYAPKPKTPPPPKKEDLSKDQRSRKLKPGALSMYMDNGQRAAVEATGSYDLYFPSGLVIVLHNCHYASSITRGVISVYRLNGDGLINCFENDNSILVSKNNLIYFNVVPSDGILEIVISNSNTIDRSILFNSIDTKSFEKCVSCLSGKMARKPYSHQVERAKDLLGLIHTNVCVPFKIMSRQGASYFITFTDNFRHYGYVYMLKHKHEVFETFKVFQKEVENQLEKIIKSLYSDHRGEYKSHEFLDHLKEQGIISHRTPPYTPQHNRVYERRNKTLLDMVCSMMSQTTLPKSFWDYALESVSHILNMVPNKKVEKTPYEVWNVEFFENILITQEASGSLDDLELIQKEHTHLSENTSSHHDEGDQEINKPQSDIIRIRRSIKTRHALDRMCLNIKANEYELGGLNKPANYKAALLDPEFDKWLNAMNVEIQSMKDNKVWDLFDLPPKGKTVGSKWLFKKKTDMDGAVHTYRSRLVVKGFTQTPGINYEETFSLVADIRAIRILIAIVAFYDYAIWQMDVKATFLNGYLSKHVYMEQPEGFFNAKYPNRVCKLKRFIYGLKQASRSYVTFLILYVDDILIMGNNIPMLQDVKSYLERCIAMKDLEEATYILEIKIYRDRLKRVSCYTNAGYLSNADDLKSQTGYVFVLNEGDVDWKSTKQSIFTTSSTEAEYIAASDASKEAVWVRKFIFGLGVVPTIKEPIKTIVTIPEPLL